MEFTNTTTPATLYVDDTMLATKWQRFANLLIDFVIQLIIALLLGVIASVLYFGFGIDGPVIWIETMDAFEERLLGAVILLCYYGLFETLTSSTPGKYITKTKVVLEDGSKPDAFTILLRSLCRIIPFEPFSFFGTLGRGWHDSLSRTYVVDKKKYEAARHLKNSFDEIGRGETI